MAKNELAVILGQLFGNRLPNRRNLWEVSDRRVFGEVKVIAVKNGLLYPFCLLYTSDAADE